MNLKTIIMGAIEDKHHERSKKQKTPTNPTGDRNEKTNKFDIDDETIKDQQNKE